MLGFELGLGGFTTGAGETCNLLQRGTEPERIAGELHRGGVGEVFAFARDRGLDDLGEKNAAGTDEQHHHPGEDHPQRDGRGILAPHGTGQAEEDVA